MPAEQLASCLNPLVTWRVLLTTPAPKAALSTLKEETSSISLPECTGHRLPDALPCIQMASTGTRDMGKLSSF